MKNHFSDRKVKRDNTEEKMNFIFGNWIVGVAKERVVRWCSTQDKGCGAKTDTDCQQLAIVQGVLWHRWISNVWWHHLDAKTKLTRSFQIFDIHIMLSLTFCLTRQQERAHFLELKGNVIVSSLSLPCFVLVFIWNIVRTDKQWND